LQKEPNLQKKSDIDAILAEGDSVKSNIVGLPKTRKRKNKSYSEKKKMKKEKLLALKDNDPSESPVKE
jgi:hypothetical protein